jgi:hypothetical protein
MKLLIAIPTKTEPHYEDRLAACWGTWLKDVCPAFQSHLYPNESVYWKSFSDANLGLTEINQHDNANDNIRTLRTKLMAKYTYDNGYDFMLRIDADAYCYVNRLLASDVFNYDYVGNCLDYPKHLEIDTGRRTAHGGAGFILSRKALAIIANAPVERCVDKKFWGDIWVGEQLWKNGVYCHRDMRFVDKGDGHFNQDQLPLDHGYITIHPLEPAEMLRIKPLPAETVHLDTNPYEYGANFDIGGKRPDVCPCRYCHFR